MKKIIKFILCLLIILLITGCSQADIVGIPKGYVNKEEYYQKDGFGDYTDYAKYMYNDINRVIKYKAYKIIHEEDIDDIKSYFDDLKRSMEGLERENEYDFDTSIINPGDYVRIKTHEGETFANGVYGKYDIYSIYFFDIDTKTLYYIHHS